MTPEEIERFVLVASDASHLQNQQQANALLNQWVSATEGRVLADALIPVLTQSQHEVVLFFVLTTILKLRTSTTIEQRVRLREELLLKLLADSKYRCWRATYLRTKVGVLLAYWIELDFANGIWITAFEDMQSPKLLHASPDIFLRTLVALMDDFGHNETSSNAKIKDILRGYDFAPDKVWKQVIPSSQSKSAQILKTMYSLLLQSLDSYNSASRVSPDQIQICLLALTALKGFMAWIDLSLILDEHHFVLNAIFDVLAKGSVTDSPMADAGVVAVQCLQELIARGMEEEKKVAILVHTNVLEKIHTHVNLESVDASPIDVVLEVARFIDRTGLEVISTVLENGGGSSEHSKVRSQLLDLFFRCFAYDDIDVSGAVVSLAGCLISFQESNASLISESDPIFSRLLDITFRQMRYPEDFQFDYEDEDEAEEEMYRTELRKLNQRFIRAAPGSFLQFMCKTLAQLPVPLSAAPTVDVEAALRLVYHYCEGIRPPPGMKVVMRDETFCDLLIALHSSDITMHPHREVLTLYYETTVRYYPLLKRRPDLLQAVLGSLTGVRGLQHHHPRVRSRCCYMLLRLVKSVGNSSNDKGPNVMRPYVESAVAGIQALLENKDVELRSEDTLNLFETIGLLLGKTGVEPLEQQRLLTQVITPHIYSIEQILDQGDIVKRDPDTYGEILSSSIAAIAFLSKGFKRPKEEVQLVLVETLHFSMRVLETLPDVECIRNKTLVFMQRLIQCLEEKVLPVMPRLLQVVIAHCTEDDILDVAQLHNQLCIKFKEESVSAIDASLIPFLQKCHALATNTAVGTTDSYTLVAAPHQRTAQLSIQKLNYMVLNHIAMNKATSVLYSPANISSLEGILQTMSDGAIRVEDVAMKKTCLVFFKEVSEDWIRPSHINADVTSKTPQPSSNVVQGFVQFVSQTLIPGVLASFAQPTFSIQDANQWRCVLEVAALMDNLRLGVPDIYQQHVLVKLGLLPISNFMEDRKSIERNLKALLNQK